MNSVRILLLVSILAVCSGISAENFDYPEKPVPLYNLMDDGIDQSGLNYVGSCMWRGTTDAAVVGDHAYLAMQKGLMVLDISDPSVPVQISKLHLQLMWSWSIEVDGNYAYFIDYYGLKVIDISDPYNPVLAGTCNTPEHTAYDIAVNGDYAYIAMMHNGLQVIDISDPFNPTLAGSIDTPGNAKGVEVRPALAFVADYAGGLQMIDISDPQDLDSIGAMNSIGYVNDLDIESHYGYLACRGDGLRIVDLAKPQSPVLVSTFPTPGLAQYIQVYDTIAYVADSDSGMLVINVANPLTPVQIGSIGVYGKVAEIAGQVFVVEWNDGMSIVNVDSPGSPYIEGQFETPLFGNGFAIKGNYAYGAGTNLSIVDISDPVNPYQVGAAVDCGGGDVAVVDTIAYVSSKDSILRIANVVDPSSPYLIDTVQSVGYCYNVASNGDYAFLTTWQDGLVVVNTVDPEAAYIAAKHMSWGRSGFCELVGDRLYLEEVLILDVSDPLAPDELSNYQIYGNSDDIEVVDTLVYLASRDSELMTGWLRVVNIADLQNISEIGWYLLINEAVSVAVSGNIVYITDGVSLMALDVTDPTSPSAVGSQTCAGAYEIEISGGYVYVATPYGLMVYQYSQLCGDANDDGNIDVGDAVYIIKYVFAGGPPPPWICKADANADGVVDVGDAVYLISYIFRGGEAPSTDCCP